VLVERGQVRRGYFVAGLGAAQFALPGAVDRLRGARADGHGDADEVALVLGATDPAQPYGAALPWPESAGRPARAAGAQVVLRSGRPLVWLDRAGRHLVTFPAAAEDGSWAEALVGIVKDGRFRALEVRKVDGQPVADVVTVADELRRAGFADGYRGLVCRA
jgi:ATP-dependent helicase Lhr and Lhr-like helicase